MDNTGRVISDADARGGPGAAGRRKGSARAARAALVACCVLAAGLGAWNLGFGLPFLFRPDEDVMVGRAVRMAVEHSLDPLFYNYPPLAFYLFAAAERGAALLPGVQLGPATEVNPSIEYLAARAVSMLAGVAAVGLTWAAGARAYGVRAGTIAAGTARLGWPTRRVGARRQGRPMAYRSLRRRSPRGPMLVPMATPLRTAGSPEECEARGGRPADDACRVDSRRELEDELLESP